MPSTQAKLLEWNGSVANIEWSPETHHKFPRPYKEWIVWMLMALRRNKIPSPINLEILITVTQNWMGEVDLETMGWNWDISEQTWF